MVCVRVRRMINVQQNGVASESKTRHGGKFAVHPTGELAMRSILHMFSE